MTRVMLFCFAHQKINVKYDICPEVKELGWTLGIAGFFFN
jgi:hypothetical protein